MTLRVNKVGALLGSATVGNTGNRACGPDGDCGASYSHLNLEQKGLVPPPRTEYLILGTAEIIYQIESTPVQLSRPGTLILQVAR